MEPLIFEELVQSLKEAKVIAASTTRSTKGDLIMTENTDIVIIEIKNKGALITVKVSESQTFFTEKGKIDPILEGIREEAMMLVPDVTTAKGRAAIASAAHQVSVRKSAMEKHKMELSRKLKDIPKMVDANWRDIDNYCKELKNEVRKPLDAWEAEQEAIKKAEEEAILLKLEEEKKAAEAIRRDNDHEFALLLNAEFDRKKAEEAAQIAEQKRRYEEAMIKAATDRATAEAEARAKKEKEEAEAAVKAANEKLARQAEQAKKDKENAQREFERAKAKAVQDAVDAANAAAKKERDEAEAKAKKIADEILAKQKEEAQKQKDKQHIASIRRQALDDLMAVTGCTEDAGRAIILAIAKKQIRNLTINY